MPNIKSAMKRDAKSKVENARNRARKTALRTVMKKFDAAVAEGNKEAAASTYKCHIRTTGTIRFYCITDCLFSPLCLTH